MSERHSDGQKNGSEKRFLDAIETFKAVDKAERERKWRNASLEDRGRVLEALLVLVDAIPKTDQKLQRPPPAIPDFLRPRRVS